MMRDEKRFVGLIQDFYRLADKRAELMPDERACIEVIFHATQRLSELGWGDPIYCPKDGKPFDVIELGSTGIFQCRYVGKWPEGHWETCDDCDVYPSSKQPMMYRARRIPADSEAGK